VDAASLAEDALAAHRTIITFITLAIGCTLRLPAAAPQAASLEAREARAADVERAAEDAPAHLLRPVGIFQFGLEDTLVL